ncbi:MAG: hypothetical protein ACFE9S_13225 [Candidatus Hermodarchaeota archaeon]
MAENIIKTFKLNFDGTFDEVAYENIKEVFTIVNILAIYIQKIKTMYIWIGRNATQALKNHISQIRVLLKDEFPDFRIIRNITFDMRAEPQEFFDNLNMKKEELYEIINYQEKTVLPILEKVDVLKENSEKLMKSEQYKNAIELLKKIIDLAKQIEDDALVTEQTRLISELTEKYENKEIVNEIEAETKETEKEYTRLVNSNNILEAHNFVQDFIKKFEGNYDLSLIPSAKELILKEKRKWNSEQEKLTNDLNRLEKELNSSLENLDVPKATEIFEEGLELLKNLLDNKIKIKWNELEKRIQETSEKIEFIEKFEFFSKEFNKFIEDHQFKELKLKINEFLKQLEIIDLPGYRSKLNLLQDETLSAEQSYVNINKEIGELVDKIKFNRENNNLNEIITDSSKLISLAKSIHNIELVNSYTNLVELTKKKIKEIKDFKEKQNQLKTELSKLEEKFNSSLEIFELEKMDNILEDSSNFLSELVADDVKNKWEKYRDKYKIVRQFLEDIGRLSKNAIEALNNRSFPESLDSFTQIITQLQDYEK